MKPEDLKKLRHRLRAHQHWVEKADITDQATAAVALIGLKDWLADIPLLLSEIERLQASNHRLIITRSSYVYFGGSDDHKEGSS